MIPNTEHMEKEFRVPETLLRVLFICGILSSLLYIGTDIFAATKWNDYSYIDQTVSELMAIEAPTRPILRILLIYDVLVIAFGLGVILGKARQKSLLRFAGVFLVVFGLVGFAGYFFPMHVRGGEHLETTDIMHIILSSTTVLSILLFIGFGSAAYGKGFRIYSIVSIIAVILFGALAGLDGPRIAAQLPTPWVGIKERACIYSSMLWVAVLAIYLLSSVDREELFDSGITDQNQSK